MSNMIFSLFSLTTILLPIVFIVLIIYFGVKYTRRAEKRADERLKLERESTSLQEKQLQLIKEMDARLIRVEKILSDID